MHPKQHEAWNRASEICWRATAFLRPRRTAGLVAFALLVVFLFQWLPSAQEPHHQATELLLPPYDPADSKDNIAFEHGHPKIQLLIPATSSNDELCKAISSASILGYAPPVLVNWGQEFTDTRVPNNGTHLAKITGVLKYLESRQPEIDRGLVVIVDGYDTWFQLRPEVLAARYGSTIRSLKDLMTARSGSRAIARESLTQSIIFAADKICGPNKGQESTVLCYAQPESPLPKDTYGEGTDVLDSKEKLPLKFRPRYLNSGFIAGPARELRTLFRQAQSKIHTTNHNGSDQHIFNEIYGEQEYQRAVMRYRLETTLDLISGLFRDIRGLSNPSVLDRDPSHIPMKWHEGHPLDFGMGLDYWLQLSQTAVLSEWDGRYLTYNGSHDVDGAESPRDLQIPEDVLDSPKPYVALSKGGGPPANESWTEVPLYTNIWTGSIPVSIHMNGFKTMREAIWQDMWYQKQMRELLQGRADSAEVGAFADTGEWLSWNTLCSGTEGEVFRDARGPWSATSKSSASDES